MSPSPPDWQGTLTALAQVCQQTPVSLRHFADAAGQMQAALNYIAARYGGTAVTWGDDFGAEDFPLEIGSLFGVRYWTIPFHAMRAQEIILCGARRPWQPGENRAECLNKDAVAEPEPLPPGKAVGQPWDVTYTMRSRPHTFGELPDKKCHCGYWAYWQPNSGMVPGIDGASVCGVIEGWGRYRTGKLGFRCAKAQIVALHVIPPPADIPASVPGGHNGYSAQAENWRVAVEEALTAKFKVPVYGQISTMLKAHPTSRQAPPGPQYARGGLVGTPYLPAASAPADARWTTYQLPEYMPPCASCHRPAVKATLTLDYTVPLFSCARCMSAQPCSCSTCTAATRDYRVSSRTPPPARLSPRQALDALAARREAWKDRLSPP